MQRPITTFTLVLATVALLHQQARADGEPEGAGWVKLGDQTVDGEHDEDTISIGRDDGRFTKLTFVVPEHEVVLDEIAITFADDELYGPDVGHHFRAGHRAVEVDLPGGARGIRSITLTYGVLDYDREQRRDRRVRDHTTPVVQVWGLEAEDRRWRDEGWDLLATKQVTKRRGTLTLKAPRAARPYDHVSVVAAAGHLRITDVTVKYRQGGRTRHRFDDAARYHQIDLDAPRKIRSITLSYVHQGGRRAPAAVEVWGHEGPTFDTEGWTLLGEQPVDGEEDQDVFPVGREHGALRELALRRIGGVEVTRVLVRLRRGNDLDIDAEELFGAGSRWGRIDLPGKRAMIEEIELEYGAMRGDGTARVQIWVR